MNLPLKSTLKSWATVIGLLRVVFGLFFLISLYKTVDYMVVYLVHHMPVAYIDNPRAWLSDAYNQLLVVESLTMYASFYFWILYRSKHWISKLLWFWGVFVLGPLGIFSYIQWRLWRVPLNASLKEVLVPADTPLV